MCVPIGFCIGNQFFIIGINLLYLIIDCTLLFFQNFFFLFQERDFFFNIGNTNLILGFFDCLLLIADGTAVSLVDEAFLFAAVDEFGTLVAEPFKLVLFLLKVYGIFTGFVFFIYGIDLGLFGVDLLID